MTWIEAQSFKMVFDVMALCVGLISIIYFFLNKNLQYWKNRNVPHIKPIFFYGNSRGISTKFHPAEFWCEMYTKLKNRGPVGGVYMYFKRFALITDLDLLKQITIKDFNSFSNRMSYFNERDDPLSAHVINLEGEPWKKMRNNISPIFSCSKLKLMFETFIERSVKLVSKIQKETINSESLGIGEIFSRYVTDVLGSTEFGIDCNSLEDKNSKFYQMALKDFASFSFLSRVLLGSFRELGRTFHVTTTDREVGQFYTDVLEKTIKYRKENPHVQREDLTNLLMKLNSSTAADALSFNQIAAQAYVFSVAGNETSSAALTFCVFELSSNDDVRKRARESVFEAMKKNDGLSYEALNDMHYLQQCINESLRKYPPVPSTSRVANSDYQVEDTNIVIEKGTTILCPIYPIHTDPEIYPQPEKYDPDRFLPEEVSKRHPFSFLPFGQGPRGCMASRYANLLLKITLAKILTDFEFKLDRTRTKIPLKIAPKKLILMPNEEIYIHFSKIEN